MAKKSKPEGDEPEVDTEDQPEAQSAEVVRADPEPGAEAQSAEVVVGETTDPHHALTMIKDRVSKLHQMVHNIGNVAEVPVYAIENLVAELKYLLGVARRG